MYLNDVIRCIRTPFYTKMSDELLHGLTLEERVDKTRAIFERILRDERLSEFEPEAAVDGEFQAFFFGCERECFACQLVVNAPGGSYMKAECYLEGRVRHSMQLSSERGVNFFVEWMVEHVGQFMRRRADLLFVTQRLRLREIRSMIERNPASLGLVRVKTYRYGITSWDSLVNQRGPRRCMWLRTTRTIPCGTLRCWCSRARMRRRSGRRVRRATARRISWRT